MKSRGSAVYHLSLHPRSLTPISLLPQSLNIHFLFGLSKTGEREGKKKTFTDEPPVKVEVGPHYGFSFIKISIWEFGRFEIPDTM